VAAQDFMDQKMIAMTARQDHRLRSVAGVSRPPNQANVVQVGQAEAAGAENVFCYDF
jgi:hypothetical protein